MESKFTWNYLKSSVTFGTITETFLHIIDLRFLQTSLQIASRPGRFIREYLKGEIKAQNPISFYLSSLLFLFILYYLYQIVNPSTVENSSNEEGSEYLQYWITLPFILVISSMNMLMFRQVKLNYLSNLIIATYIEAQSVLYLTLYLIGVDYLKVLNGPMTQALIYVLIIFGNTLAINFRTFQLPFFSTFWRTILVVQVAFFVMIVIAGFL